MIDTKLKFLYAFTLLSIIGIFFFDRMPQDPNYHNFIDQRTFFDIPNFWNTISNVFFLFVGIIGLKFAFRIKSLQSVTFFAGIALVSVGSSYYHLFPENSTLVWDRLPMTIAFMSFLSIVISDFISNKTGQKMLIPLVIFGISSIIYWHYSELNNVGDLRPYILVQFLSLTLILCIIILYQSALKKYLYAVLSLYTIAKLVEVFDQFFYDTFSISGHSLKHIIAAMAIYYLYKYQRVKYSSECITIKRDVSEKESLVKQS